jgi:glyoxylase-like metal-dependent hydrolase (beta-lactamase superfamily II)
VNEIISGVYQLPDGFVNLYLILEPDGLTLIDTGQTKSGERVVRAAFETLKRPPTDLKRILVTHADPDHTGGAAALKNWSAAQVMVGKGDAGALARGEAARPPQNALVRVLIKLMVPKPAPLQADVLLEDGMELPVLGGLRVVATPGHTGGHVAFYSPRDRVLFAGDALRSANSTLVWSRGPFTLDFDEGMRSVRRMEVLEPKIVLCGHGTPVKGERIAFPK